MKITLTDFNYMPILKTKFYFIKISVRENAIPKIRRKFIAKDHFTEESRPDSKIRSMKKEKKKRKAFSGRDI